MSTPLGHFLLGAAIGAAIRPERSWARAALIGGVCGVAADLDFLPGLVLGDPARFHNAFTHSFACAAAAGVLLALACSADRRRWLLLGATAFASHLLLDYLTFDDSPPFGIPLFWPWSSGRFTSPQPVFDNVVRSGGLAMIRHNLRVAGIESLLIGPVAAIICWWRHRTSDRPGRF